MKILRADMNGAIENRNVEYTLKSTTNIKRHARVRNALVRGERHGERRTGDNGRGANPILRFELLAEHDGREKHVGHEGERAERRNLRARETGSQRNTERVSE